MCSSDLVAFQTHPGVRRHLEGKQRTSFSSRVATGISWSPLSGLKGQLSRFSELWLLLWRSLGSKHTGSVVVAPGFSCSAACGIFPDQGSNPCPLHWQVDSYLLRQQGSPKLAVFLYIYIERERDLWLHQALLWHVGSSLQGTGFSLVVACGFSICNSPV